MKKNIALSIILMGILLSCVGCTTPADPTDTVESDSAVVSTADTTEDPRQEGSTTDPIDETTTEPEVIPDDHSTIDEFYSTDNADGTVTIYYKGSAANVDIPSELNGKTVTVIGQFIFHMSKDTVRKVTIPETVTTIEDEAFQDCINLTEVNLPDSLTHIGAHAFANCKSLKHIRIPGNCLDDLSYEAFISSGLETVELAEGITMLPSGIFAKTSLREVVTSSSLVEIKHYAFGECKSLEKITLNEGLTSVAGEVFTYSKLSELVIPSTVTHIEELSFSYCLSLTKVKFHGSAPADYVNEALDRNLYGLSDVHYTVYYHEGAEGFTSPTWNGYTTDVW